MTHEPAMRILLWTEFFWPHIGGNEVLVMHLSEGLRRRGHDVLVVTGQTYETFAARDEYEGIEVRRFPFRQAVERRDLEAIVSIRRELLELVDGFQPDLIHLTWLGAGDVFYHQLRAARSLPAVITVGQHLHRNAARDDSLLGRTLGSAAWVATCSAGLRETLLQRRPELATRSSVIFHALKVPPDAPTPMPAAPRLLCLGRLVACKGFDTAMRAVAMIAAQRPELRLVIAGDGPERAALKQLAMTLGIEAQTEFLGWIHPSQTTSLIEQARVVIMPSREETFGLVALETAIMARAIVASRVEGLAEVVADGESGLLVPVDDVPGFAQAIARLVDDPELCARLGRQARPRALDLFDWDRHLDRYEAVYSRVAPRDSSRPITGRENKGS
jgi:glycogen synthase